MEFVTVRADAIARSPRIRRLVRDVRRAADGFVFLSGGAANISRARQRRLLALFDAFTLLAERGVHFAVGDGGTKAGIMEAAGRARRQSGNRFPLVGVTPAREVTRTGDRKRTRVEPHHSHLVAVENPAWRRRPGWRPSDGYWGSEIEAMYALFARLARGRPSVAVVANGGSNTLEEVRWNMRQNRPIIVVEGSGRAADAIVAVLRRRRGSESARKLLPATEALAPAARRELFHVFPIARGPAALAALLRRRLAGWRFTDVV